MRKQELKKHSKNLIFFKDTLVGLEKISPFLYNTTEKKPKKFNFCKRSPEKIQID
jgi:hypothetical protein